MKRENRQSSIENRKLKIVLWLGWVALLTLALLWRLQNIDAFGLNNDEGAYLMWARLVAAGYPLYSQTYTGAPPLFIEMLALVFKLFGFGIVLGRLVVLAHFVALAIMLSYLSYRIAAWPGAYLALFLLVVTPPFFSFSRQVMLELPAMTFAVAAVLCAYIFWEIGVSQVGDLRLKGRNDALIVIHFVFLLLWRNFALLLSGVLLAASLLIKILHPLAAAPILIFIYFGSRTLKSSVWRTVFWGLAAAATMAFVFLFFDLNALLDQVFRFRMETRSSLPMLLPGNWQRFTTYISQIWGLGLLALAGIAVSVRRAFFAAQPGDRSRIRGLAWTLWLAANFILLMWYDPVFPHHFTIILPALILLSVEFIASFTIHNSQFTIQNYLAWGVLAVALFNVPAMVKANQSVAAITTGGREAEASKILAQVTRPTDFVMSDSQLLALSADRLTPPPLVDFSLVYIQSRRQTPQRLIAMSEEYAVAAVAPWALRMVWLPDYIAWAEAHFLVHKVWDNDHQLYFGPKHPAGAPIPNEQTLQFEGGITFRGYSIKETGGQVGRWAGEKPLISPLLHLRTHTPVRLLPVTLYWQADTPVARNYTVFAQLIAPDGTLAAQNDSQPIYGYYPTSQWRPGEIVPDRITIALPRTLSPGRYTLIAGLYDAETLARLPLADGSGDYVALTEVEIGD